MGPAHEAGGTHEEAPATLVGGVGGGSAAGGTGRGKPGGAGRGKPGGTKGADQTKGAACEGRVAGADWMVSREEPPDRGWKEGREREEKPEGEGEGGWRENEAGSCSSNGH